MVGHIVEIAEDDRHLSALRGFLRVECHGEEVGRVALDDISALIINAHGLTYTNNLVTALSDRKAIMVICGPNHMPKAWLWPMEGHHQQGGRVRHQIEAGRPLQKRLWQTLVRSKIDHQANILDIMNLKSDGLRNLKKSVRSGDPDNIEAQAARRYFLQLFGKDFRRDRSAEGLNSLLNYGYTVLRAMAARAITATGLHPSIGLHHHNKYNAMALVDDLMEPFRPLVDLRVRRLMINDQIVLDKDTKAYLARIGRQDMTTDLGVSPLAVCVERLASSLAQSLADGKDQLVLPGAPLPLDQGVR
ncbi:type II CRISPR-associated endonuclease Cas1 [Luteithermobacter gelatinilyticus]|uniref:type II CRISPR-associated endonuclease Cas1 n=1 Tax=Luteithermobacter gelatinilyticus TaxID=2582913 RepID=UPI00110747D8|nr:type II CRISPR-associated endonuclease Cas1 [Luteithermobacter gelatinilyticus]|tara:strand:+ start:3035 stop:3943 length:909 start_codon:yes stop_codon:yes gene_type:complete